MNPHKTWLLLIPIISLYIICELLFRKNIKFENRADPKSSETQVDSTKYTDKSKKEIDVENDEDEYQGEKSDFEYFFWFLFLCIVVFFVLFLIFPSWNSFISNLREGNDDNLLNTYETSLSNLYNGADLKVKTTFRDDKMLFQLRIFWFDWLIDKNKNKNKILSINFLDKDGFNVSSYTVSVSQLIPTIWDDSRYSYDWEIPINIESYEYIADITFQTNISPDSGISKKENTFTDNSNKNDTNWKQLIREYYNSIKQGRLEEAYALSVQKSSYDVFYDWFKDVETVEIHSIENKWNDWYSIDVTIVEKSWDSTNYKTDSRVWMDNLWVYRILETKITQK